MNMSSCKVWLSQGLAVMCLEQCHRAQPLQQLPAGQTSRVSFCGSPLSRVAGWAGRCSAWLSWHVCCLDADTGTRTSLARRSRAVTALNAGRKRRAYLCLGAAAVLGAVTHPSGTRLAAATPGHRPLPATQAAAPAPSAAPNPRRLRPSPRPSAPRDLRSTGPAEMSAALSREVTEACGGPGLSCAARPAFPGEFVNRSAARPGEAPAAPGSGPRGAPRGRKGGSDPAER